MPVRPPIARRALSVFAAVALLGACGSGDEDSTDGAVAVVGDSGPVATSPIPTVSIADVPDASSEFGLPARVVVDIDLDGEPGLVFDVSPATLDPTSVGIDSAVASCWAIEGPDWLPAEVLVVADDSSSIRIVESPVATRSRSGPEQGDMTSDGVEVVVALDRGDGRPIAAVGRLFADDDLRSGRVEAVTDEGRRLDADYRCEGEVADPSDTATVEVSLRLVEDRAGGEVVRTFGLRADGSVVCRSGSDTAADLLAVDEARWMAGGLTGITVGADGTVTAMILGSSLTVRGARLDGAAGMGILSAVTENGARLDGAWSCRDAGQPSVPGAG